MKKVMVIFGFLSVGMFFWHSILSVRYFYGKLPYTPALDAVGGMLAACLTVHIVLTLIDIVKNARKMKGQRFYSKYTVDSSLQNITGISLIGFLILHVMAIELNRALHSNISGIIWWAVDLFFYLTICLHLAITLPHTLITYGIVTHRIPYNIARAVLYAISILGFVMLAYSHTVFCFNLH